MAVGFQRRNVGRLTDLSMGGGTEAFRDFVENPIALAMADQTSTPSNAPATPVEGEVLPPEAAQPTNASTTTLAGAEAAAQQLIAMAEKQRAAAGNPLNRGLSFLGGILGAPINILDGILSGGDMSRVTAPFRPQQNANQQFLQTVMGINDTLGGIRREYAQIGASNASALASALKTDDERKNGVRGKIGWLALNSLYGENDQARQQMFENGIQAMLQGPDGEFLRQMGYDRLPWNLQTAARLIAETGDKDLNAAYAKLANPEITQIQDGSVGIQRGLDGQTRFYYQGQSEVPPPPSGFGIVGNIQMVPPPYAPQQQQGGELPPAEQMPQSYVDGNGSQYSVSDLQGVRSSFLKQDPQRGDEMFQQWAAEIGLSPVGQQ